MLLCDEEELLLCAEELAFLCDELVLRRVDVLRFFDVEPVLVDLRDVLRFVVAIVKVRTQRPMQERYVNARLPCSGLLPAQAHRASRRCNVDHASLLRHYNFTFVGHASGCRSHYVHLWLPCSAIIRTGKRTRSFAWADGLSFSPLLQQTADYCCGALCHFS